MPSRWKSTQWTRPFLVKYHIWMARIKEEAEKWSRRGHDEHEIKKDCFYIKINMLLFYFFYIFSLLYFILFFAVIYCLNVKGKCLFFFSFFWKRKFCITYIKKGKCHFFLNFFPFFFFFHFFFFSLLHTLIIIFF